MKKIVFVYLLFGIVPIYAQTNRPLTTGKALAGQYCQSCHLLPEPSLLDKKTWVESVLPNMGLRLGIKNGAKNPYEDLSPEEEAAIKRLGVYPEIPLLSIDDWQKIVDYYQTEAPETPLPQKEKPLFKDQKLPHFTARLVNITDKPAPKTSLLKFDNQSQQWYVGNAETDLYVLDNEFKIKSFWSIEGTAVDVDFPKNTPPRLMTIGSFKPSDQATGKLITLDTADASLNFQHLARPVQFAVADLNADGKDDVVVCNFGNHSGKLAWYDALDPTKEHILNPQPGARKVEIRDLNNDQRPDIVVLMAQAFEQMIVYYNNGKGQFVEKTILRFSPAFGASYFEMVDFNKDGFQDILLTNGDNWDYSSIPKNYHGIRIFLNDGRNNFTESWFYPLYGTSKAIAHDFDKDGDLDIAATSFYADLDNPAEAFVYLQNNGKMQFEAYTTPEAASGKWLTMEAADYDHDGDIDIVLGSYFHTLGEMTKLIFKGITEFPQLLVFTNGQ